MLFVCVIGCGPPSWPGGIRALLGASPRGVRVVKVPDDSPAAKAGLQVGDFILAIDGKPIAGLPAKKLHELLTGEVGTIVLLRIDREGSQSELRVTRAPYDQK
jgi:carboxyl-terminal processing protease